jgi:hypothetical protein
VIAQVYNPRARALSGSLSFRALTPNDLVVSDVDTVPSETIRAGKPNVGASVFASHVVEANSVTVCLK